jgi:hypothetical protein
VIKEPQKRTAQWLDDCRLFCFNAEKRCSQQLSRPHLPEFKKILVVYFPIEARPILD